MGKLKTVSMYDFFSINCFENEEFANEKRTEFLV